MTWLLPLTLFVPLLAAVPGGRWALPLVAPLTLWLAFRDRVRERDYLGAWLLGMAWACLLSAGVILLVLHAPETARAGILHGEDYRREMFGWVATGAAPENDPRAFIPQHLLHLGLFLLLTWASGGYLGLAMGAALVGYMSCFVGFYAAASGHPFLGPLIAWVPWSVLRVAAFVLLGALFSRPLLARRAWPFERWELRLMGLALAGILLDVLIKALFAPSYGIFLRQMAAGGLG
ncbi:MAG TPA: hypothetical protein VGH73_19715 [Thermoanaerobaculia bacterium]|jgi:hypothetical protein